MIKSDKSILTINAGSSSIKFALYTHEEPFSRIFSGEMEKTGTKSTMLNYTDPVSDKSVSVSMDTTGLNTAPNVLIDWLDLQVGFNSIRAIGHRIVHGMQHTEPETVTDELIVELKTFSGFDPEHLPEELNLIELIKKRNPDILQVACFDTSFHTSMPAVARLLPIPRRLMKSGVRRYGFHGISYSFLMQELERLAGKTAAGGKIILAHLGNGASLCAVREGKSMETSMGFTPSSGIPMGTRTGDIDPGVLWYLMQVEKMTASTYSQLINHQSGLLGISETSSDMRDLLQSRPTDPRAADAIDMFCYQIKKCIGSFTTVLGGLDTLVFSGGIGENAFEIREEICGGLGFLGIQLDALRNKNNEGIISSDDSRVTVRVIHTNEQLMIARAVAAKQKISIN